MVVSRKYGEVLLSRRVADVYFLILRLNELRAAHEVEDYGLQNWDLVVFQPVAINLFVCGNDDVFGALAVEDLGLVLKPVMVDPLVMQMLMS
jgi:hypothetical protein